MDERYIYQLLSQVPIDEEELANMEQMNQDDEMAKARLKKQLKRTLFGQKKNSQRHAAYVAAAAAILLVGSTAYIGITNPAYAAELPIVGDIFRFIDNGRTGAYDLYQENANEINVTKEDQGIAITIREAVFDGQTVYYTYELSTERQLGKICTIGGSGMDFRVKGYFGGMTGSDGLVEVADGKYVGEASYSIDEARDDIDCRLNIRQIRTEDGEVIEGRWPFEFNLQAVETQYQQVYQSAAAEGYEVSVDTLERTPMSFSINYSQTVPEEYRGDSFNLAATAEIEAKDDLGNVYIGESQGGHGNVNEGTMNWRTTFGKLNEQATKLIITPSLYYSSGSGGGVTIDNKGNETPLESWNIDRDPQRIYLEDIVIELEQ